MTTTITLRAFPVVLRDERTGKHHEDIIVLDKPRLQAAQLIGRSSKELIHDHYNRKGYKVLDIGKAEKLTAAIDLQELYRNEKARSSGRKDEAV